jgi:BolA protein
MRPMREATREETVARMRACLERLAPVALQVEDESDQHVGHPGARGGGHFRLRLVSPCFRGLTRMARHRLVYDCLSELMQREIHALSMTLLAPDE